jgi:hypothetical protein
MKKIILLGIALVVAIILIVVFAPSASMAADSGDSGKRDSSAVGTQIDATDASADAKPEVVKKQVNQKVLTYFYKGTDLFKKRRAFVNSLDMGCRKPTKNFVEIITDLMCTYDKFAKLFNAEYDRFDWISFKKGRRNYPMPVTDFYFGENAYKSTCIKSTE